MLCLFIPRLLQFLATTDLLTVSMVLLFFQNVRELDSYSRKLFQIGLFHLVTCVCVSSASFHGLIAHSFLVMDNTHQHSFIDGPTSSPLTGNAFSNTYEVSRGTEVFLGSFVIVVAVVGFLLLPSV